MVHLTATHNKDMWTLKKRKSCAMFEMTDKKQDQETAVIVEISMQNTVWINLIAHMSNETNIFDSSDSV